MCCVNMATPIHSIADKCHTKLLKAGKSHETCLTNCTWSISHHIMPLVINTLRGGHTDRHTDTHTYRHTNQSNFKKPGAKQVGEWKQVREWKQVKDVAQGLLNVERKLILRYLLFLF